MAVTNHKLLRAAQLTCAAALVAGAAIAWVARPASASPGNDASQLAANKSVTGTVMVSLRSIATR